MADDEQDPKEYRWETGYEKTWEAIKEDEDGLVQGLVAEFAQKAARKAATTRRGPVRLGMMRHLLVAIDCSEAMSGQDLKPMRFLCTLKLLEKFVEEFFDQNPLSQLGVIAIKNKRAEKITELSGNIRKHIKSVQGLSNLALTGEPSLQNTLELAGRTLRPLPGHASRELLVLFGSLTTCDPGDINTTIQTLKSDGIRCSVIGLAAEVRICKKLCQDTGGEYGVVLDDVHYRSLLMEHTSPPARARALDAGLVKMGFPYTPPATQPDADPPITVCMCHLEEGEGDGEAGAGGEGHVCPQCRSKYCSLPAQCRTCGLTLASAPHLARIHHYLTMTLKAVNPVPQMELPYLPRKRREYYQKQENILNMAEKVLEKKEEDWECLGRSIGLQLRDLNEKSLTIVQKLIPDAIYYTKIGRLTEDSYIVLGSNPIRPI